MLEVLRSGIVAAAVGVFGMVIGAGTAWATPITWQATGHIGSLTDPIGNLDAIDVGTLWTLEITFDPDTPGVLLHPGGSPTYLYDNAISSTRFQLGGFEYTNTGGDVFVNADLPVIGTSTPLGGPGLVQFQWLKGWVGGLGGPDLNLGLGMMLASFNDTHAADGSLPGSPTFNPNQGQLGGLLWDSVAMPNSQFSSTTFNPTPVPEPTSLLLFGSGIALLAASLRSRGGKKLEPPRL